MIMRKLQLALLTLAIFLLLPVGIVHAQDDCEKEFNCTESHDDYSSCLVKKKACLENALVETKSKKTTLENTISIINGNINIQQVKISQTKNEISQLEAEITELDNRISGLSISLDRLSTLLVERIRTQYKREQVNPLSFVASSKSLANFVSQFRYLRLAGQQTAQAMQKADSQKAIYDTQKELKELKQAEVETKRSELQSEQNVLVSQRQEQQNLLSVTQNDEKKFQQLIAEAEKELQQIQSAANIVIREGNAIKVSRGEVIGTMGSSGHSTGAHLHFGVYRYSISEFEERSNWGWYYSNYVNPIEKLESTSVLWDTGCANDPSGYNNTGTGSWLWPMSSNRVTQNYGSNTCYNYFYGGKPHPALDLVAIGNISVRAVDAGDAYFCRNCLGDGGNGVFIFHEDRYMTLYWHLK